MRKQPLRVVAFAIFCTVLAGATWYGARWAERLPGRLQAEAEARLMSRALGLRDQFFALANFQPRVRVNQRVISERTAEIAEVALLEKQIEVEHEFIHTWAGSTKKVRLRGQYLVKCGYNLLDKFEIQVERGRSRVLLAPAVILSVEQKNLQIDAMDNGLWNPISAEDLQSATAALKEQARSQSRDLTRQVDATFADRLRRLLGEKG